ncbi:hypothetical protein PHLCEN_2v9914, partial [Hermanssonia centrifuga]
IQWVANLLVLYVRAGSISRHHKVYKTLIKQIAAPDIVLQLVPYEAIELLRSVGKGNKPAAWLQVYCPAFGAVVNSHSDEGTNLPHELQQIATWLATRAKDVYTRLAQHDPAPIRDNILPEDWQQTGTCYGMPATRRRRWYSKLQSQIFEPDLQSLRQKGSSHTYKEVQALGDQFPGVSWLVYQ